MSKATSILMYLSAAFLVVAASLRWTDELCSHAILTFLSGGFVLLFFGVQLRKLGTVSKIYLSVSLAFVIYVALFGKFDVALLIDATDSATFLVLLLVATTTLKTAAENSKTLRDCGVRLVRQPPSRRYLMMVFGANLFGLFLSIGAINTLNTMVYNSLFQWRGSVAGSSDRRIQYIRLRRMSLAILRGLSSLSMWSPISIPIAVALSKYPQLTWLSVAKIGVFAAVVSILLGWLLDRMFNPKTPANLVGETASLRGAIPIFIKLVVLAGIFPFIGFLVSVLLDLQFIFGLLVCMPALSVIWLFAQRLNSHQLYGAAIATAHRVKVAMLPSLVELRSEFAIFASAGFLSVLLFPQINIEKFSLIVAEIGISDSFLLVAFSWAILILAFAGVNAIFSLALTLEVLRHLPNFDVPPIISALALAATFSVVIGLVPISVPLRIAAACIKRSPLTLGVRWNGVYSVLAMLLISISVLLVN